MSEEKKQEELEPEELDEQNGEELPDREAMSVVKVPWEGGITLPDPLPPDIA